MRTLSQAAWLLIGRLSGDALAFGLFVLIARAFGPAGTGAYFFTFAVATVFYEIVSLGTDEYGVREYARSAPAARRQSLGRLAGAQLSLGLALALAVLLLATTAAGAVDLPLLAFLLAWQLAFAVSRTLFVPAFVAGRVMLQVLTETTVRAAALAAAALTIALSRGGASLATCLLGLPICGAALVLVAFACGRRFGGPLRLTFSAGALGPVLRSIWPFAAANVVSGVYTRTAILVLFFASGTVESGLFAGAYKFAELAWALLILVPWAGYPALVRLMQRSGADFRVLAHRLLGLSLVCGGLFAWGTYWIVPPVIETVLGPEFVGSTAIVQALAIFVALTAVNEYLERIALAGGLQVARLKVLTAQAAVNVILNVLLVPRLGVLGAAAAFTVSQAISVPMLLAVVRPCMPVADAARPLCVYALALGGAGAMTALPVSAVPSHWAAAVLSLVALLLVSRAGGLLDLARAAGAWRVEQAWGR